MALASSQFSNLKKAPLGAGRYMVTGTFTGPASYTSGGEDFTNALVKASLGIRRLNHISFTDLVDENNAALAVTVAFDHNRTTSSQGKIRFINSGQASHTHDLLVIGGAAAAGTDTLQAAAADDTLTKEEAGDVTIAGADVATKGGVVASTVTVAGTEVAAATNLSGYVCSFVAYGC